MNWQNDSDYIERQKAIDAVLDLSEKLSDEMLFIDAIVDEIENVPSAEPERKKGRWQRRKGSDCWECSQCHAVLENDDIGMHNFYFCYHCGADMMNKSGYMDLEEVHYE